MYKQKLLVVVLLFSILHTSCFSPVPQSIKASHQITWDDLQIVARNANDLCKEVLPDNDKEWELTKKDFNYGLLGNISIKDASKANKIANRTIWVNANQQQTLKWRLWYPTGNDRPANLRLFVLLDERQLTEALPKPGVYNDIRLEKGDNTALEVTIPPLDPGIHDVIAIGIPYLDEYPNEHGIVKLVYWRITLMADPSASPFRQIDFTPLTAEGSIKRNAPLLALELTLKNDEIDIWNWPNPWVDNKENTPLDFFALIGHEDVINEDAPNLDTLKTSFSSLILFIDYQQIEFKPNQLAIYNCMDDDVAYARIPITVNPLPIGKHHMLVLRIDTPGVPTCLLQEGPKNRILPNSVYGKLVGINVIPSK